MNGEKKPVNEISCLRKMYNPDESSHLKCYKHHMYSYMVAKGYPTELLLYAALENTQKIEEFVYDRKGYKWEYDSSYLAEEDWFLIGVYAERSKVAFDFDTFVEMAKREIDRDHPVLFFAPRIQVPYFQKVAPVDVNEQGIIDNVHSFFMCGYNEKSNTGQFFEAPFGQYVYEQDLGVLRENYKLCPEKWFSDSYAVYHLDGVVDREKIFSKHVDFVESHSDPLMLYQRMYDAIEIEYLTPGEMYDRPFLNAVTLLFGSRVLFKKFIDSTAYGSDVKDAMNQLVKVLRRLDTDSHGMLGMNNAALIDTVKSNLLIARNLEEQLITLLKNNVHASWHGEYPLAKVG